MLLISDGSEPKPHWEEVAIAFVRMNPFHLAIRSNSIAAILQISLLVFLNFKKATITSKLLMHTSSKGFRSSVKK